MLKKSLMMLMFFTLVVALGTTANATPISEPLYPIYGQTADLSGTRSIENGGLEADGAWEDGFAVSWNVTKVDDVWNYVYTLDGYLPPGVSHLILDLSDDCVLLNATGCITDSTPSSYELGTYSGANPSNPGMPGTVIGVKFPSVGDGEAPVVYSFTSTRAPVWGDFYAKGGQIGVWNVGLGNPELLSSLAYIARPNGLGDEEQPPPPAVPEPSTLVLLAAGLSLIAFGKVRLGKQGK